MRKWWWSAGGRLSQVSSLCKNSTILFFLFFKFLFIPFLIFVTGGFTLMQAMRRDSSLIVRWCSSLDQLKIITKKWTVVSLKHGWSKMFLIIMLQFNQSVFVQQVCSWYLTTTVIYCHVCITYIWDQWVTYIYGWTDTKIDKKMKKCVSTI